MNKLKLSIFIIFSVILLDQVTKLLIMFNKVQIRIFSFFSIWFTQNSGAAFGIFRGANLPLLVISFGVLGVGVFYYKKILAWKEYWAYALICGGIIGNLIDRVIFNAVTDFIAFSFWPTFNIADSALSIGVLILVVYWFLERPTSS